MRLFIIKQTVVLSAICFELSFENRMRNSFENRIRNSFENRIRNK